MKIINNLLYLAGALLLISCDEEEVAENEAEEEVLAVHDTVTLEDVQKISTSEVILNDTPAITITTGINRNKFINISLSQANITEGYSVAAISNNDQAIEVKASWGDVAFIQSEKHSTNVNLDLVSIDPDNLLAKLKFSAVLVNPLTEEVLMINESELEIGGKNFYRLVQTEN